MKTKTNRILSLLLTLTMVLGMLPAMSLTAFAAEPGISSTGSTANAVRLMAGSMPSTMVSAISILSSLFVRFFMFGSSSLFRKIVFRPAWAGMGILAC